MNLGVLVLLKAAVDLDRVARDMDVYTLQDNIDHITFCNIESEIVIKILSLYALKPLKYSFTKRTLE